MIFMFQEKRRLIERKGHDCCKRWGRGQEGDTRLTVRCTQQKQKYFLRRLRSFSACRAILQIFYHWWFWVENNINNIIGNSSFTCYSVIYSYYLYTFFYFILFYTLLLLYYTVSVILEPSGTRTSFRINTFYLILSNLVLS